MCPASARVERRSIQKLRYLRVRAYRHRPLTCGAIQVCRRKLYNSDLVVRICNSKASVDRVTHFHIEPSPASQGRSGHRGLRNEHSILTKTEYGQSNRRVLSTAGLNSHKTGRDVSSESC